MVRPGKRVCFGVGRMRVAVRVFMAESARRHRSGCLIEMASTAATPVSLPLVIKHQLIPRSWCFPRCQPNDHEVSHDKGEIECWAGKHRALLLSFGITAVLQAHFRREFYFREQPVIQFMAGRGASGQVEFVRAHSDLFVGWGLRSLRRLVVSRLIGCLGSGFLGSSFHKRVGACFVFSAGWLSRWIAELFETARCRRIWPE